jgi:hypothetical protein
MAEKLNMAVIFAKTNHNFLAAKQLNDFFF